MLSLNAPLNVFNLLAVGVTGTFYVRVEGRIAKVIYEAQTGVAVSGGDPLSLALRRAQVMYWRARRFTLSFLALVVLQLTAGQGVRLRSTSPPSAWSTARNDPDHSHDCRLGDALRGRRGARSRQVAAGHVRVGRYGTSGGTQAERP